MKPVLQRYILYASNYIAFCKKKNQSIAMIKRLIFAKGLSGSGIEGELSRRSTEGF